MFRKTNIAILAGLGILIAGLVTGTARADAIADFYRGKQMTIVVGFGAGGGYDRYSRLVAKHIVRFLPGNPTMVPQFMPGGGSLKMANYLYNVAPRDGSIIGMHSPVLPIFQLVRSKGFKLDVRNFIYIGSLATQNHVMMVRADHGVKTLEDAKKKEVIVSSTGRSSPTFIYPTIMNSVLGTKFKVVTGYKGSSAGRLAMERGEVHGLTSGWISWKANVPHWIESKFMIPLVEVAPANSPDLKGVPLLQNLAKNADERKLLEFISSPAATGRAVALPPNVPKARVAALRAAFDKMVKDKAFLAAAKKRRVAIEPMQGVKVQARIRAAVSISPALIKQAKTALGYK